MADVPRQMKKLFLCEFGSASCPHKAYEKLSSVHWSDSHTPILGEFVKYALTKVPKPNNHDFGARVASYSYEMYGSKKPWGEREVWMDEWVELNYPEFSVTKMLEQMSAGVDPLKFEPCVAITTPVHSTSQEPTVLGEQVLLPDPNRYDEPEQPKPEPREASCDEKIAGKPNEKRKHEKKPRKPDDATRTATLAPSTTNRTGVVPGGNRDTDHARATPHGKTKPGKRNSKAVKSGDSMAVVAPKPLTK
jgi:hypothetical protein